MCSLVFCLVGWRTLILISWSSSDAWFCLSQPSLDVRVWELAAWILSVCLCFPCSNTTAFMGTATNTTYFAVVLEFKGSFWHKNLRWHVLWSRVCAWFVSLQCKQRAAWALLSWAGIGTRSCHPGCLSAYSNWHPLDLCGSADKCKSNGFSIWKTPQLANFRINNDLIVFQNSFGV